jgi:antirestriction protein ArdC
MFIAWQGGRMCNSYKGWQAQGRQVRRGEKATIKIRRPCVRKVEQEDGETEYIATGHFAWVGVFDVSQTDGPPITYKYNETKAVPVTFAACRACAERLGYAVKMEGAAETRGWTDGETIGVTTIATEADKVKTILHEMGHCLMSHSGSDLPKTAREVEATIVCMLVLATMGVEFEMNREYLAAWKASNTLVRTMQCVGAAQKIINEFKKGITQ